MTSARDSTIAEIMSRFEDMMVERRRHVSAKPLHRGISMVQMYILMALQERETMTMSEVALLLQVAAPSASAIVDRMEEHGVVRRTRSEADRRVVHVEITAAGTDAIQRIMGLHDEEVRGLLDSMSDEDLQAVVSGLRALVGAIARARAGEEPGERELLS